MKFLVIGRTLNSIMLCSLENCDRPVLSRGLCSRHYQRERRSGRLPDYRPPVQCSIEGCEQPPVARLLCSLHYQRQHFGRDMSRPLPVAGAFSKCRFADCARLQRGDGVCRSHGSAYDPETADRKLCDGCGKVLPRTAFYQAPKHKDVERQCRVCRKTNARLRHVLRTYGEDAAAVLVRIDAGEPCAVCGLHKPGDMCIDHCHETGEIRGVLCRVCNAAIGQLGDSAERLRAAASYLEEFLCPA